MPTPAPHPLPFFKYQGTGNDFVLLDWTLPQLPDPATAIHLCDRRRGIGADGLLLLTPPTTSGSQRRMVLFNPDGTRPEMCGNGLRCAAMHVARAHPQGLTRFSIETDAGLRDCQLLSSGNPSAVRVDMGRVSPALDLRIDNPPARLKTTSVGNPHAVLMDEVPPSSIPDLGRALSAHPAFPHGTNVGFPSAIGPNGFDLVVFERGAGLTLACGTGACAAVASLWSAGHLSKTEAVRVHLPGGDLTIDYDPTTGQAYLAGDAHLVFEGTISLD